MKEENLNEEIKNFWEDNPCGENLTGKKDKWEIHFKNYDKFRYSTESHILQELNGIDFKNKNVLEIGIGQAADSEQIVNRGGIWNGLDITDAAIERAKTRFSINKMKYGEIKKGSAIKIPWPDNTFDIVYSHGVLHHIKNIEIAQQEISRVLKPKGELVIMLYNKNSLNYWISIRFIRRVSLLIIFLLNKLNFKIFKNKTITSHINNIEKYGLFEYLKIKNFIHRNTDGPENPYSRVYALKEAKSVFNNFLLKHHKIHFINKRHFPGISILQKSLYQYLEGKFGWHIWLFFTNKKI